MSTSHATERTNLRTRIIENATRMFAEHGFSGTSIRRLVEECGCTKPALYYYFDNKETLFREVVSLHVERTGQMARAAIESPGPVRERVHAATDTFIAFARSQPMVMRLLQRIETQPEDGAPEINIMAARELHLQTISALLEQGVRAGQVRANIAPHDCALILAGTLSFQFEMALVRGVWDEEQIHRTIDLIFDGLSV